MVLYLQNFHAIFQFCTQVTFATFESGNINNVVNSSDQLELSMGTFSPLCVNSYKITGFYLHFYFFIFFCNYEILNMLISVRKEVHDTSAKQIYLLASESVFVQRMSYDCCQLAPSFLHRRIHFLNQPHFYSLASLYQNIWLQNATADQSGWSIPESHVISTHTISGQCVKHQAKAEYSHQWINLSSILNCSLKGKWKWPVACLPVSEIHCAFRVKWWWVWLRSAQSECVSCCEPSGS